MLVGGCVMEGGSEKEGREGGSKMRKEGERVAESE